MASRPECGDDRDEDPEDKGEGDGRRRAEPRPTEHEPADWQGERVVDGPMRGLEARLNAGTAEYEPGEDDSHAESPRVT